MQRDDQGPPPDPRQATMSETEVRRSLDLLEGQDGASDQDPVTRLAWRPAWSIRSRRGALAPFLDLFRKRS